VIIQKVIWDAKRNKIISMTFDSPESADNFDKMSSSQLAANCLNTFVHVTGGKNDKTDTRVAQSAVEPNIV